MSESFTAKVYDIGGGRVDLLVDRDTEVYPPVGTEVTVTVHQPRYFVRKGPRDEAWGHEVIDRLAGGKQPVAQFNHYRDSQAHADEYAARLNREDRA